MLVGVRRDLVTTWGGGEQSRAYVDVGSGEAACSAASAANWGVTKGERYEVMVVWGCKERDGLNAGGGGVAVERKRTCTIRH